MLAVGVWMALSAATATAQYTGMNDPATGETYHVELAGGIWKPTITALISSESLGIPGTEINLVDDLGIVDRKFSDLRAVLRLAKKHKLRASFVPIKYEAEATLKRTIVFNGISYNVGLPVNSSLDFKAWRFGYEYDFIYRDRGFIGFILEAKYTDITASLASPFNDDFATAKAPVPAVGLIARGYLAANVALTGELTGIKLPGNIEKLDNNTGEYWDLDVYGTLNFTDNFGVQGGYRRLSVEYRVDEDFGDLKLKGFYVNGVVRF